MLLVSWNLACHLHLISEVRSYLLTFYSQLGYGYYLWFWTAFEVNIGLICACVPAFKTFFTIWRRSPKGTYFSSGEGNSNQKSFQNMEEDSIGLTSVPKSLHVNSRVSVEPGVNDDPKIIEGRIHFSRSCSMRLEDSGNKNHSSQTGWREVIRRGYVLPNFQIAKYLEMWLQVGYGAQIQTELWWVVAVEWEKEV